MFPARFVLPRNACLRKAYRPTVPVLTGSYCPTVPALSLRPYSGTWGDGAGKGGGSGGSIRDAGGAFGRMEAAREEEYFRRLQKQQLDKLKREHNEEIDHQKLEIERLKQRIARHQVELEELEQHEQDIKEESK